MFKIFVILIFLVLPWSASAASPCTKSAAESLAKIYTWSWPIMMSEADFLGNVQDNAALLTRSGNIIQCADVLGHRLVTMGINAYDPQAYERAMGIGPAEHAPEVAQSINSQSMELYDIGRELVWLAKVIPLAAEGNTQPFLTESYRRNQLRTMLAQYRAMAQMTGMTGIEQMMASMMDPLIQEKIVMLAMMVGG